jgi:hypothetical protein
MRANLAPGVSQPGGQGEPAASLEGIEEGHCCEYLEDQALILAPDVDPRDYEEFGAEFGFEPATANDLFLSLEPGDDDLAAAEEVLAFWSAQDLGAFELINPDEDLFNAINEVRTAGFAAAPHYLLQPAGFWRYGPYSRVATIDPALAWDDLEVTGPIGAPEGGRLVVIDTGANSDLSGIGITVTEREVDPSAAYPLDPRVVGHGTFAASIAKQYNPGLDVELYRANFREGTFNEASLTEAFMRVPDVANAVVSLSAGTYPCGGAEWEPLGIQLALSGQVVAASGNDGSNHMPEQLYPASRPDVIGVSAYDVNWTPAAWANPGEVYAPGEDVVGWYSDGNTGSLAVWSGSSFATPHHAACIASGFCPTQPTGTTTTSSP